MIQILDKKKCVGCNACTQICPKSCIQMIEDTEGFLYPKIDKDNCIECDLCEKVCPVIFQNPVPEDQPQCFAAKNRNEKIRDRSSSGGVFTLLAESVLEQGGVVFGAKFDADWNVVHSYTETQAGLSLFRGSKYVQSQIEDSYRSVLSFLRTDRIVLFSGTPCQIAGLKRFLRKEYPNLLCIDFVCHGVPSPKVWRLYLAEQLRLIRNESFKPCSEASITDIQFRNKKNGWKSFSLQFTVSDEKGQKVVKTDSFQNNIFMRGFLHDLYLRPSCYACPAKKQTSGSDITLADFWGIQNHYPNFDDDKGVSLILVNTEAGMKIYHSLFNCLDNFDVEYSLALQGNSCIEQSVREHSGRSLFFHSLDTHSCTHMIERCTRDPFKVRMINKLYHLANDAGIVRLIKKIR